MGHSKWQNDIILLFCTDHHLIAQNRAIDDMRSNKKINGAHTWEIRAISAATESKSPPQFSRMPITLATSLQIIEQNKIENVFKKGETSTRITFSLHNKHFNISIITGFPQIKQK